MLWYGYIYYVFIYILLFFLISFFYRLYWLNLFFKNNLISILINLFLPLLLAFFWLAFSFLYLTFDLYANVAALVFNPYNDWTCFTYVPGLAVFNLYYIQLNYMEIYFFPFIYIFFFVTTLSLIFCLVYNLSEITSFFAYTILILSAGYTLFFTDSIILFFISYEFLLVPSFLILYNFAKTRRCVEAAYLMFFWTQFGAMFLIFTFVYLFSISNVSTFSLLADVNLTQFEVNFLFLSWLIGFGVKLPIWPFYGWLPKAHVEASTNFSIFLSGVLVKFAFFGLFKCLLFIQYEPTFLYVYPFLFIGLLDAVFKLFYQIDLKKLIAYSTVVEMHWLTICTISGQGPLVLSMISMLISHALLSTNSFLLVDAIGRRFKTRLITELNGINYLVPKLFLISLINLLIFLGFPGSIMFISEILFFSFFIDTFPLLAFILVLLLYLIGPIFFFRSWTNLLFGSSHFFNKYLPSDLLIKELCLYFSLILLMFWFGLSWQFLIF